MQNFMGISALGCRTVFLTKQNTAPISSISWFRVAVTWVFPWSFMCWKLRPNVTNGSEPLREGMVRSCGISFEGCQWCSSRLGLIPKAWIVKTQPACMLSLLQVPLFLLMSLSLPHCMQGRMPLPVVGIMLFGLSSHQNHGTKRHVFFIDYQELNVCF